MEWKWNAFTFIINVGSALHLHLDTSVHVLTGSWKHVSIPHGWYCRCNSWYYPWDHQWYGDSVRTLFPSSTPINKNHMLTNLVTAVAISFCSQSFLRWTSEEYGQVTSLLCDMLSHLVERSSNYSPLEFEFQTLQHMSASSPTHMNLLSQSRGRLSRTPSHKFINLRRKLRSPDRRSSVPCYIFYGSSRMPFSHQILNAAFRWYWAKWIFVSE